MESNALRLITNQAISGSFTTDPIQILNTERFAFDFRCNFTGSFILQTSLTGLPDDFADHPNGAASFAATEYVFVKGKNYYRFVRLIFTGTGQLDFLNLFTKGVE